MVPPFVVSDVSADPSPRGRDGGREEGREGGGCHPGGVEVM